MLEIMRGCIRGCRFCQAGNVYRPLRERGLEYLKEHAAQMLKSTGHEEISLSSLSSSDYTQLEELIRFLIEEFKGKGVNISLPSLRIDAFSPVSYTHLFGYGCPDDYRQWRRGCADNAGI